MDTYSSGSSPVNVIFQNDPCTGYDATGKPVSIKFVYTTSL